MWRGRFLHGNYDRGMAPGKRKRANARCSIACAGKRVLHLPRRGRRRQDDDLCGARARARRARAEGRGRDDRSGRAARLGAGPRELSGEPRAIDPALLAEQGVECKRRAVGDDARQQGTFDEIVARLAPNEREREEILANPIYRELSSAVAGSQELSAIAKLYELRDEHDFDVIVLDTPPSRNASTSSRRPTRLLGFLEGRALQVFLSPGGLAARVFGRSTGSCSRSSRASPASTCSASCRRSSARCRA